MTHKVSTSDVSVDISVDVHVFFYMVTRLLSLHPFFSLKEMNGFGCFGVNEFKPSFLTQDTSICG